MRFDTTYSQMAVIHKEHPDSEIDPHDVIGLQPISVRTAKPEPVPEVAVENYVKRLKGISTGWQHKVYKCRSCDFVVPYSPEMTEDRALGSLFGHNRVAHPKVAAFLRMERIMDSYQYDPALP